MYCKIKHTMENTYSIPIYENGIKTEFSVDGIVGDENYFKIIEYGNGKELPAFVAISFLTKANN